MITSKTRIAKIVLILISITLFSSCVAKKKYLEMEGYKNRAEQRVLVLTKDIAELKAEFNSISNQFYANNAGKDAVIDSLNGVIVMLNSDLSSRTESIEDQTFSFQVEKRRLNQMLADRDREIRQLTRNNSMLEVKVEDLQKKINDLNINLQNVQSSSSETERLVERKERDIEQLKADLELQKSDLDKLRKELNAKNDEIEALKNQVKLLKAQFGNTN